MSELYICIDCEVVSQTTEPVELTEHGMCKRCGSSSVISCSALQNVVSKRTREAEEASERSPSREQVWKAMAAKRREDNGAVRSYLASLQYSPLEPDYQGSAQEVLNEQLASVITEWDGWAWFVYYPWAIRDDQELNPFPGSFVLELVNGNGRKPAHWFIILDEFLHEVKSFPNGTD